ncbi:MAG: hypothetical protein IT434_08010 [Phycisphaerales bacterium]|nr:hypothetical protein [Phycisphaerales bacterium]
MSDKICVVCKQDVSNKPRRKDPAGKYICEDCAKKAAAPASKASDAQSTPTKAPAQPAPANEGVSDDFWNSKMQPIGGAQTCPGCGTMMPGGAKICTRCGFDTGTGKAVRTRVTVEKGSSGGGSSKGDFKLPISWDAIAGIMVGLIVIACVASFVWPGAVLAFNLVLGLNSFLVWLMLIIIPFQDRQNGWGIFNIVAMPASVVVTIAVNPCIGLIAMLIVPFVSLYYAFKVNERSSLQRLILAGFFGGILLGVLGAAHGQEAILRSLGLDPKEFMTDSSGASTSQTPKPTDSESTSEGDSLGQ